MATLYFRGDAQGVAQVVHLTPAGVEIGDEFTVTINRKDLTVIAAENTVHNVCQLLAAAIGDFDSSIPEFAEVSARAYDSDGDGLYDYVIVTGQDDGTPFTITASASAGSNQFAVSITTIQDGTPDTNQIQRIVLPGPPSGGTFTLTFSGQTTSGVAYSASGATLQSALEALSNIAPGDVSVTKNATGDWSVEFDGAYAGIEVPVMTGDGSSLTGVGAVSAQTTTQGAAGQDEIQAVVVPYPFQAGTSAGVSNYQYQLVFHNLPGMAASVTSSYLQAGCTAAQMQSILELAIGAGNIVVSRTFDSTNRLYTYTLRFTGSLGSRNLDLTTIGGVSGATNSGELGVSASVNGSSVGVDEVQVVTLTNGPTGGTFTLTFQGQTSSGIAYNASTATVQTALEALSNIAPGDVTVTGSSGGPWTVTFGGALASLNVGQISGSGASLTGGAVNVAITQDATEGVDEQEQIVLTGNPTGGTFTLTLNAETTGGIAYNATAADVQTALEALATPVPGDFSVTGGPLPSTPVTIVFTGAYAKTDVSLSAVSSLTGTGGESLSVSSVTDPTGPHHWDEPENWSGGARPSASDIVYIANISSDILYGLDGVTNALAELHIMASFTGKFGLKPYNDSGYFEYRQLSADVTADKVFIGEGPGSGSAFINLNFGSHQTELICYGTGQPDDTSIPALLVKGTSTSNTFRTFKGSVGIALLPGETAAMSVLQVGYLHDKESDVELVTGPGVTITTYQGSGGDVTLDLGTADTTNFTATSGTIIINGSHGVSTTFVIEGDAVVFWNTTGTLGGAPVCADEAYLDFSQDMRAKTITNPIEVYSADAWPSDPFQVVSNLRVDANYSNVLVNGRDVGTNVRLTRGTPS